MENTNYFTKWTSTYHTPVEAFSSTSCIGKIRDQHFQTPHVLNYAPKDLIVPWRETRPLNLTSDCDVRTPVLDLLPRQNWSNPDINVQTKSPILGILPVIKVGPYSSPQDILLVNVVKNLSCNAKTDVSSEFQLNPSQHHLAQEQILQHFK